jgi:hypothetical protein
LCDFFTVDADLASEALGSDPTDINGLGRVRLSIELQLNRYGGVARQFRFQRRRHGEQILFDEHLGVTGCRFRC